MVSGYLVSEKPHYRSIYVLSENEWTLNTQDYVDTALSTGFYQVTTLMAGTKAKLLWSNHDVWLYDKSAVYLAASEPVPVLEIQIPKGVDRYSYIVGFNLALAGMAYPYSAPVPVAYLYNGVRLPALPEWDREVYPYAVIVRDIIDGAYHLFVDEGTTRIPMYNGSITSVAMSVKYSIVDDAWVETELFETGIIVWANYDVYYNDSVEDVGGTLYLAASNPVPVYE